ncbi:site-specific recombinase XerD [Flavobacterium gossypii]|uniref:Site-specific recombinase XerD n=1 Tax=Flavobacterium gossypii TaxID=1646119 RepID=A0ABR6DP86_9FLAO|nr:site-specific integrase [Flavobacterium gossypii]MBA9073513.1 site-specific recombinase XerD [Flavobacterium gossypii]
MNNNKLSILFLLQKARINKQGKCPIRCRISFLSNRYEFSIGLFINPKHWHSKLQIAKPPNDENTFINTELSLIKNKINQAFLLLQVQENTFTADDIFNQYKGKPAKKNIGIVSYYNDYLNKYRKLIGIEIRQSTWNKFSYILNDLKDFIRAKYQKNEMLLKDLDYHFIVEFEYYLKTVKIQKQVTINKALQRFKKVVKIALIEKLIDSNPFVEHKPKRVITNVVYLSTEELDKLEKHTFSQIRLEQVRDMFIFCCYTGLAYNEMAKLESKHIEIGFDDMKWIKMIRDKTNKTISIPMLPKALSILEKYQDYQNLLPVISNQKFNSYIKEIAEIIGIEKNLSHHTARKTFATTVLLYNDVPMEIVSELLGHSKISTTQEHYAKVVQKKVSEHISNLGRKLEK